MPLFALLGEFGSGKSLRMVLEACSSERDILGNFTLKLDNYTKIEPLDLKNLGYNKLVLLDEIYLWLESRVSSSFVNRYITYILLQCRHRSIDVYGTLQLFSSVDIRFRATVKTIIKCKRVRNKSKNPDLWDFRYDEINTYTGKVKTFILRYRDALKYFPIYDTFEILEPYDSNSLELELLKKNPRKLHQKLLEIAKEIKPDLEKMTHASVSVALLKAGYDLSYERVIYSCLEGLD